MKTTVAETSATATSGTNGVAPSQRVGARSYDDAQLAAVLAVCPRCGTPYYMTRPGLCRPCRDAEAQARMTSFPKPEKIAKCKRRKASTEAAVVKAVRSDCVVRDGYCRIWREYLAYRDAGDLVAAADLFRTAGQCDGPSQWTHLPPKTRARTRGVPPQQRHSSEWTIQACQFHHDRIDGRRRPTLLVTPLTPKGADGPIRIEIA